MVQSLWISYGNWFLFESHSVSLYPERNPSHFHSLFYQPPLNRLTQHQHHHQQQQQLLQQQQQQQLLQPFHASNSWILYKSIIFLFQRRRWENRVYFQCVTGVSSVQCTLIHNISYAFIVIRYVSTSQFCSWSATLPPIEQCLSIISQDNHYNNNNKNRNRKMQLNKCHRTISQHRCSA